MSDLPWGDPTGATAASGKAPAQVGRRASTDGLPPPLLRWPVLGVVTAIAYAATAHIGFRFAFVAEQITTVWAPTGIAIAVVLLFGLRLWPAIWIGAFVANVLTDAPVWTALFIASGNTLEAVAAGWTLRRLSDFDPGLRRVADVVVFIAVAALACTTISATAGVTTLCAADVQPWSRFGALWLDWWLGDALGAIVVAPAILTVARRSWSGRTLAEAALFVAGSLIVTHMIFRPLGTGVPQLEFVVFPIAIAAAVISGPAVTSLVVLSASGVAIAHTAAGAGPFAGPDIHQSLVLLQVFMSALATTALLLAAATAERQMAEARARQSAEALRSSRDVLSLAMRGGSMGAWSRNLATNEVWWSRDLEAIFGLPPDTFVRTEDGFFAFVHHDDRPAVRRAVDEAVANRTDYIVEFQFWHASGEWRWMEGRGRATYAADGTPVTLYGIGVDVTARKHAELALQAAKTTAEEGQQQLEETNRELRRRVLEQQTLLDVLPIGIGIALDRDCRRIQTNRAFATTLGLASDSPASKIASEPDPATHFRVVTPEGADVPDDQLPMQVAAREGRPVREVELNVVHDDGRVIHLLEYAAPLFDEHGDTRGAVGAFIDVTDMKEAEAALLQEMDVRTTLAHVGASLAGELRSEKLAQAVTDAATKLAEAEYGAFFCNATDENGDSYWLYSVSGAAKEAFSRIPHPRATAVFGPGFGGEAIVRLDDVTSDPRFGKNTPFHGMPESHVRVRSYMAVPVVGRGGTVFGGLFFGHSRPAVFTARHEQLAAGVASWAAIALENARLYQDIEQASRLKDEFLATLSHELRTPLNAVLGWAQVLREGVEPAVQQRAFESLERNARAQAQLVDDLLNVSRIMAGKLDIKAEAVDLAAIVANAVDTVRAGVSAKRLHLQLHLPANDQLIVTGDADRLQQIVWNLVSNAVKFTPTGGCVDVELRQVDGSAEIAVRDTGQGIDPGLLPLLFQRFRQLDASRTRAFGGLGLGLSIVRHLTEAHGGTVAAESLGEGHGATFRVRLPLRTGA